MQREGLRSPLIESDPHSDAPLFFTRVRVLPHPEPSNLVVAPIGATGLHAGCKVRLSGLEADADLNGAIARCYMPDSARAGRWVVVLPGGGRVNVAEEKLHRMDLPTAEVQEEVGNGLSACQLSLVR